MSKLLLLTVTISTALWAWWLVPALADPWVGEAETRRRGELWIVEYWPIVVFVGAQLLAQVGAMLAWMPARRGPLTRTWVLILIGPGLVVNFAFAFDLAVPILGVARGEPFSYIAAVLSSIPTQALAAGILLVGLSPNSLLQPTAATAAAEQLIR